MKKESLPFQFSTVTIAFPMYFVLSLWIVYWLEVNFDFNFTAYGLFPRSFKGLRGVFFSPFIHGDLKHLFNNSVPLFVLLVSLFYFYRKVAFKVLIYGTILLGLLTWLIGRDSYHIGASGIVYLLFGFIFFSGLFRKYYRLVAVSFMVIFLYGSMIWYIFPVKEGISWEGHLSGLIVGIFFALLFRKSGPKTYRYDWEKPDYQKDAFDLQFDDDGNFVPSPPPEIETIKPANNLKITYHFVENNDKEE
jgi:membrane associated rhomboid family serine protease